MLLKLKTFGLYIAIKLMGVSDFLIGLCPIIEGGGDCLFNRISFFFDGLFRPIEHLAHWLFGISYRGSIEEVNDAFNLAFDTDWKCYNEWQLQIIKSSGIGEPKNSA